MRYFSMFSGIGGFEIGIQRAYSNKQSSEVIKDGQGRDRDTNEAGDNVLSASGSAPLCIGFSEVDKYAISIYQKHFPNHKGYGDATKINTADLPDFDLLVGGFPCQAFSIAGKRAGFQDTRGTLFFEIARILTDKRPRNFLLENVKGLLSHDNGKTFQTILKILTDIGYYVEWQVLNSKDFGVPQNRERVFIVGYLGGTSRPQVFPLGQSERENVSSKREVNQLNQPIHLNDRIYGKDGLSLTLNTMQGGRRQPKVMLSEHRTELGKQTRKEFREKEGRDSTLRGKDHKEYRPNSHELANCLTTGDRVIEKWVLEDMKIRRLTPTECERLQGFPDGWTEKGIDIKGNCVPISDTQRYKVLGNAITTNVVTEIMRRIKCLTS